MNVVGQNAEDIASEYLNHKGFRIIERNWRWHHLEVDIIAVEILKPSVIHFVEVKGRVYPAQISPEKQVNWIKQRRLIQAANGYLEKENLSAEVSFDIIAILFKSDSYEIRFIERAFSPLW